MSEQAAHSSATSRRVGGDNAVRVVSAAVGLVLFLTFWNDRWVYGLITGLLILVVGFVLALPALSGSQREREAQRAGLRAATEVEAAERQVRQMAQLKAAWETSNPGQPMPAIAAPAVAASTERTNTPALLSLIFGILGSGLVAVILGHVAKSQIRRTGEQGDGMATAGLVLGYLGLAATVGVLIFYVAALASL